MNCVRPPAPRPSTGAASSVSTVFVATVAMVAVAGLTAPVGAAAQAADVPASFADAASGLPELGLSFEGCAPADALEIERVVRGDVTMAPGDPSTAVTVACGDGTVLLTATGDDGSTARTVDLAATAPGARPRTIALIAIEMILAARRANAAPLRLPSQTRGRRAPAGGVVADVPPPSDDATSTTPLAARTAAPEAPMRPPGSASSSSPSIRSTAGRRARLDLLGFTSAAFHGLAAGPASSSSFPVALSLGGRGRLQPRDGPWSASLDLGAFLQQRTADIGTAHATGGLAALLFEGRITSGDAALSAALGLGARADVLQVAATSEMASARVRAAWGAALGPTARARVTWRAGRFVAEATIDGGWLGPEVVGDIRRVPSVGVGGFWAGVSLAAGGAPIAAPTPTALPAGSEPAPRIHASQTELPKHITIGGSR